MVVRPNRLISSVVLAGYLLATVGVALFHNHGPHPGHETGHGHAHQAAGSSAAMTGSCGAAAGGCGTRRSLADPHDVAANHQPPNSTHDSPRRPGRERSIPTEHGHDDCFVCQFLAQKPLTARLAVIDGPADVVCEAAVPAPVHQPAVLPISLRSRAPPGC